jgi:hypothetical protein
VDCGAKKKWMGFKYREAKAGEDEIVIVAAWPGLRWGPRRGGFWLGTEPGGWETGHVSMWTCELRAKRKKKKKEWRELLGRLHDRWWIFTGGKDENGEKRFTHRMTDWLALVGSICPNQKFKTVIKKPLVQFYNRQMHHRPVTYLKSSGLASTPF